MPARFIPIGEPAHDAERQAIRSIVDGLDERYTVYGNPWLVDRGGSIFELDAVVVAPHALYVVEIKTWRGDIRGNDLDWYIPEPTRSPLRLNRKTAQILATHLRARCFDGARPFVDHFVYLSHASKVQITGPASAGRIHTRASICDALRDAAALERREGGKPAVDANAARALDELLQGADRTRPPRRQIREWLLLSPLDQTARYVEHLARHSITGAECVLRVYTLPWSLTDEERDRREKHFRWECQVLRRIGEHPGILHAEAPIVDEAGFALPFDRFKGVTAETWITHHAPTLGGADGVRARVAVWRKAALAIAHAHRQGVVHRLLRPEVILVEDEAASPDVRVTGFELAKQVWLAGQTIVASSLSDERKRLAAPEVLRSFSDVDGRADQFGLGVLLALLLAGQPIIDSTDWLVRRGQIPRIKSIRPTLPAGYDEVLQRLLAFAPAGRFASVEEAIAAIDAVEDARRPAPLAPPRLDPDDLPVGTRLDPDYEITGRLGAGGLATVYAARHLVSGQTRALKVARAEADAEEALREEHRALKRIDHERIVHAIDLTSVVPDRLTLVLERVRGEPLGRWRESATRTDEQRRQVAEHLLAALEYLEQRGVVHKDIKPDNLIASDDGLTLIDFSLAGHAPENTQIGTPLYRDPTLERWSPAADRYAAALCLFELWVGRHAFDGHAPMPGEALRLDGDELDRPALADFFRRALHPLPNARWPSTAAMRAGLRDALGMRPEPTAAPSSSAHVQLGTELPLAAAGIEPMALAVLRRSGIHTQGELVALSEAQLGTIAGLGDRKRALVLAARHRLVDGGVEPAARVGLERRSLWPTLIGATVEIHQLALPSAVETALLGAGYSTVGALAEAAREDLAALDGFGPKRVQTVVVKLQEFAERQEAPAEVAPAATLAGLWERASRPLDVRAQTVVAGVLGIRGKPLTRVELADHLGVALSTVSISYGRDGLERLDRAPIEELLQLLEMLVTDGGGILRLDELAARVGQHFPDDGAINAAGLIRLAVESSKGRLRRIDDLAGECGELVARPTYRPEALRAFVETARLLAGWPPKDPEGARRSLRAQLPEYTFDPLELVVRLLRDDVRMTDAGELYQTPVDPSEAVLYVLRKEREFPVDIEQLRRKVLAAFGEALPELTLDDVVGVLQRHQGVDFVLDAAARKVALPGTRSIEREPAPFDPLPIESTRSHAEVAAAQLRDAAPHHGYRLVVTLPEIHAEAGRSVARALGPDAAFVSFEDAFFSAVGDEVAVYDKAERFRAQRPRLTRKVDDVLAALVELHGQPGRRIVLGDTALFGVADALHLVRTLYDRTRGGERGFWVLVIPGVIHGRQPLFNERPGATVFSLEGAALPLREPIPAASS